MKILLTGASGFIGKYLAESWQHGLHDLICVSRNTRIPDSKFQVIYSDLSKSFEYSEFVDIIVHTAAQSPAPGVKMNDYLDSNVDSIRNLIRYAQKYNVKKFINLSSVLIYGDVAERVVDERTPIIKPGRYGLTKYIGEKLIGEVDNIATISLRLPGVLGKGARTPWLVKTANKLKNNELVKIYNAESLFNNLIYVSDLEKFICRLMDQEWYGHKIVTLGSRDMITVYDVVNKLKSNLCSSSQIEVIKAYKNSFVISNSDAYKMGYDPMCIDDILEKYCNDFLQEST